MLAVKARVEDGQCSPCIEVLYCSSALSLQQFCSTNGPRKDCFVCLCKYTTLYMSYHNEVTLQK